MTRLIFTSVFTVFVQCLFSQPFTIGNSEKFHSGHETKLVAKPLGLSYSPEVQFKHLTSEDEHVSHSFMIRASYSAWAPISLEVSKIGGSGFSFGSSFEFFGYLDNRKTVSFSTHVFAIAGDFDHVHFPSARLVYHGLGFINKWDYHWLRWAKGSLYSGVGFGLVVEDYDFYVDPNVNTGKSFEDGAKLSAQASAIGIQYAPFKHFGAFAELGVGYEGILRCGWQVHW